MKRIAMILLFGIVACSNAAEPVTPQQDTSCEITYNKLGPCVYAGMEVNVVAKKTPDNDLEFKQLTVKYKGKSYSLDISQDAYMIEDDIGLILFDDINFDGVPDVAVTTTFRAANTSVDYWINSPSEKKFIYVGNYEQFTIDAKNKTLTNEVKISAAEYEKNRYIWEGNKLKEQRIK